MDAFDLVAHNSTKKAFREGLRVPAPIALRSNMHRDDIEDVDIVVAEDLEVAATRQVLKIEAGSASIALASNVDRAGEIDAADVLEVISLPACVFAAAWPVDDSDEDDAFLARAHVPAAPISTQSVSI